MTTNFNTNPLINKAANGLFDGTMNTFGSQNASTQIPAMTQDFLNSIMSNIPAGNSTAVTGNFNFATPTMQNLPTFNMDFSGLTGASFVGMNGSTSSLPDERTPEYQKIIDELAKYGVPSTGKKDKDEAILKELKNRIADAKIQAGDIAGIVNKATRGAGTDEEALAEAMNSVNKDNVEELLNTWDKNYEGDSLVRMVADDTSEHNDDRAKYMTILADALAEKMKSEGLETEAADFKNKVSAILSQRVRQCTSWSWNRKGFHATPIIGWITGAIGDLFNAGNNISNQDQIDRLDAAFNEARKALANKTNSKTSEAQEKNKTTFTLTEEQKRQKKLADKRKAIQEKREDLQCEKELKKLEEEEKKLGLNTAA